jgi:hypothetical protein
MACRDLCGHWQVYFDAFVTVIPKIDFSLFVVFLSSVLERLAKASYWYSHTAHTATDSESAAIGYS